MCRVDDRYYMTSSRIYFLNNRLQHLTWPSRLSVDGQNFAFSGLKLFRGGTPCLLMKSMGVSASCLETQEDQPRLVFEAEVTIIDWE